MRKIWVFLYRWWHGQCTEHGIALIHDVIPDTAAGGISSNYWFRFCPICDPDQYECYLDNEEYMRELTAEAVRARAESRRME